MNSHVHVYEHIFNCQERNASYSYRCTWIQGYMCYKSGFAYGQAHVLVPVSAGHVSTRNALPHTPDGAVADGRMCNVATKECKCCWLLELLPLC